MKKLLCFLVILTSISFSVLSMQVDIQMLHNYIENAKQAEAQSNKQVALGWYKKVAYIRFPEPSRHYDNALSKYVILDPYKDKRELRNFPGQSRF